jgi:predicted ATP-grasp superfamily ATP-dependent carboligase
MTTSPRLNGSPIDNSTPLFVLRLSLAEFQHGVLAVARSAGRLGIPVYAVRRDRHEPAIRSRYITGALELPDGASDEARLEAISALGDRIGRALLVAIDDRAAVFVADHARELSDRFLLPAQPSGLARQLASKREMWELCRRHGIPAPVSWFPASGHELLEQAAQLGYPVVVKRSDPWLPSRDPHAPSVCIARDRGALISAYDRMESTVRPHVLLQEYLAGGADSVWVFNGYFDARSDCLCWFTGRKLRQYRPRVGPASLGVCETNSEVAELSERFLRGIGYRGIVDMGFRRDPRDGSYKLLDVNPRIGSSFRMFVGRGGLDVLRAQYLDLTGQSVAEGPVADGRKWIVEPADLASAAQLGRTRELTLTAWLRSLKGIEEAAWWAADDPLPFVRMCTRLMPHTYSVIRRQNGARRP